MKPWQQKYNRLIRSLEDRQQDEFNACGKSDYFLFLEDVICEVKDLKQRWDNPDVFQFVKFQ